MAAVVATITFVIALMASWRMRRSSPTGFTEAADSGAFARRIAELPLSEPEQKIDHCRTSDYCRIAYAVSGERASETPIVRSMGWPTHLEAEWAYSQGRALWSRIGQSRLLYRYDGRGMGLSATRCHIDSTSPLNDLEAVVDATDANQVVLLGIADGAMTAIEFAVKYPDRVTHLVLHSGVMSGQDISDLVSKHPLEFFSGPQKGDSDSVERGERALDEVLISGSNRAHEHYVTELLGASCSAQAADRHISLTATRDVSVLATKIRIPTLVLHCRGDLAVPVDIGPQLAETIPNARLRVMPGNNHSLLAFDRYVPMVVSEIERHLADG